MTLIERQPQAIAKQAELQAFYARFIAYLDAKPRTVQTYNSALRQFFSYLAAQGIQQPQRDHIMAYRDSLITRAKPTTVQAYMVAIRLFFRWTAQEGLYPDIADKIKGAKLNSKRHKRDALTAAQVRTILQAINQGSPQGRRDYAIVALMVTGGLRDIEVVQANIEDMRQGPGGMVLYIQGKGWDSKDEYISLAGPVEAAIRAYLAARGQLDGKAALFASASNNSQGQRMTTRSISAIVKSHLRAAGYDSERLTAHSLRHTAGTLNLLNGGTLQETQQLLRHSNINTTMIYLHNLERAANRSEQRIAAAIF
jgi:integrase/recombinase XerC